MAKQGFSYYKAETDRFQDIKIKRLKKKYHCTGYAVYQYVLNEIYRVRGYFLRFTEDQLFDVSEYWGIDEEEVKEIIGYCAEIGLFDTKLWQASGVLTARSIQARYIDICKVCKKTPQIENTMRLVPVEQAAAPPPAPPALFTGAEMAPMHIIPPQPVAPLPTETELQGVGASVLAELEANEAQPVSEDFRKVPEVSGNFAEKSDKSIKSYASISTSSNSPTAEEAEPASLSREKDRLRQLLQSVGCGAHDWQWVYRIEHIEADTSPVWQLVEEMRQSGGRLTFGSYIMPTLRGLVQAGRLHVREPVVDTSAELRRVLAQIKVPSYDIDTIISRAEGMEPALREAIDEVRRSKGKINMPARYILSKLRKMSPAKAS